MREAGVLSIVQVVLSFISHGVLRRVWFRTASAVALILCASYLHAGAQAQPTPDLDALKKEQELLFQKVLRDPKNLDVAFRHAEISTALGDYEAAIGSLERMLFFNPN